MAIFPEETGEIRTDGIHKVREFFFTLLRFSIVDIGAKAGEITLADAFC